MLPPVFPRAAQNAVQLGLNEPVAPVLESLELRRLLSAGDLDAAFGGVGYITQDFGSSALGTTAAVQPADSKILLAGIVGDDIGIARYNPDGTLDSTFDGDGLLTLDVGSNDLVTSIKVRNDGKIVVAGDTVTDDFHIFAATLNSDGSFDTDFGGIVIVANPGGQNSAGMSLDNANNAYVVGSSGGQTLVVRFTPTGLDTNFGVAGTVTQDFTGGGDQPNTIGIQSTGKIVIGGVLQGASASVARLNPDGSIDTDFGVNGVAAADPNINDTISGLTIDSADNILLGASFGLVDTSLEVIRLQPDGPLDLTFGGGDGFVDVPPDQLQHSFSGGPVAVDPSGRIVTAGVDIDNVGGTISILVARFTSTGVVDATFGTGGHVVTSISGSDLTGAVGIDGNGDIIVGGTTATALLGLRYLSDDVVVPPSPVFVDGFGNLVVNGTANNDTVSVTNVTGGIRVTLNSVIYGPFTVTGRIKVDAGDGADSVTVANAITIGADISGGIGNDTLTGGGGNDSISGDGDNDIINGRNGDDTLVGGSGADSIVGGNGADSLLGEAGNDTLRGNAGNDFLDGGDNDDDLSGNADNDTSIGGAGNDSIANDGGDDQIFGGIGNDTLKAGGGADVVYGEDGNDSIVGGVGNDSLFGGNDNDTVDGSAGNDIVDGGAGNDDLNGGGGTDIVLGGADNDIVQGGAERDILIGGVGADSIIGNADEDVLISGSTSHDGNIAVLQSAQATWTSGSTYAVRVAALQSGFFIPDSTVFNDTSVDTLTGGAGNDWFVYNFQDGGINDIVDRKAGETGTDVDVIV